MELKRCLGSVSGQPTCCLSARGDARWFVAVHMERLVAREWLFLSSSTMTAFHSEKQLNSVQPATGDVASMMQIRPVKNECVIAWTHSISSQLRPTSMNPSILCSSNPTLLPTSSNSSRNSTNTHLVNLLQKIADLMSLSSTFLAS